MVRSRAVPADGLTEGLPAAVKAIYLASFPPEEREPFAGIMWGVRRRRAALYIAEDDDAVAGFGLTLPLRMRSTAYLAYLAVRGDRRGQGVGADLFRFILEEPARHQGPTALVWEVERAGQAPVGEASLDGGASDELKRRRIAFYRRQGGVLLDAVGDFRMPATTGPGTIPAWPMWASAVERPPLSLAEVRQLVVELFRVGYGRGLDDPLVRAVLGSIRP